MANAGYYFVGWTENDELISDASEISFVALSDRNLVATFIQAIEIGADETTCNYLPSYSYYNYTMTQQIYTAEEIGTAGTISCIAFYNEGAERTRTYDLYLATTEKSSFSDNVDWITMEASDKVFSGNVTMAANAWTFIVFDTPFEYDGTSNLVLVADDNSGRYDSSPYMACSVYNTSLSQTIYAYSSVTNFNPLSPPTAPISSSWSNPNDVLSVKNHILMGIGTNASHVQQTIELTEGWNYFSTYIDMNEVDGLAMLEEALGDYGLTIVTFDDSAENLGDGLWVGLEGYQLTNGEMVMVEVTEDCQITLEGPAVDPGTVEITLNPEWTYIGYPFAEEMSIDEVMSGFEPEFGDGIYGVHGTTEYLGNWSMGDFTTLVPGQGYMYYSYSDDVKILVFQNGRFKVKAVSPNKIKNEEKPRPGLENKQ